MPYVNKEEKVEDYGEERGQNMLNFIIEKFYNRCLIKEYDNVRIPVEEGSVQIFKPEFLSHGTVIQANISPTDAQLIDFFGNATARYRERWRDQGTSLGCLSSDKTLAKDIFALYFEKQINGAEFFGDKSDVPVSIPLTMQIYPGRLEKDNEDFIIKKGVLEKVMYKGKERERYYPVFVRELIFNSEKMDRLNGFLIRKGIDDDLHKRNLMMAETAKKELGFNYKERKGECLSQVCVSPEEVFQHDLPAKLLRETKKDSFKEMVLNLSQRDKYNSITTRMDVRISPELFGKSLVKVEAENSHEQPEYAKELFTEFFSSLNPEIPEGSAISFLEFEESGAMKHAKTAGRVAKKVLKTAIPVAIGAGILYEGGKAVAPYILPYSDKIAYGAAGIVSLYLGYKGIKHVANKTKKMNIDFSPISNFIGNVAEKIDFSPILDRISDFEEYLSEKTKDSIIVHPIKVPKERKAEEEALVIDHLESLGIRTNETRPSSCLLQIDKKKCAEIARAKIGERRLK